jgi:hypothetical protein
LTARCVCGQTLGRAAQDGLPGTDVESLCVQCQTDKEAKWMLTALPTPKEREWDDLGEFEHGFVMSLREQIARGKHMSEKQFEVLTRIYKRHA